MIFSRIIGSGSYLPEKTLSNFDLEKQLDTTHEWIVERTGIEERRIAGDHETVTYMGKIAAEQAMAYAGVQAKDIDLIIVATCTPDLAFPATACLIQQALNIAPCPAFDVQAACSGFIYALNVADKFIKAGQAKHALVIGSEAMSRILDWQDRKTCVLFGDGAGAVVLKADTKPGILSIKLGAEGRHKDLLYLKSPSDFLKMQGNAIYRLAVTILGDIATQTLAEQNCKIEDLDWLVPHQANIRIMRTIAEKLNLPWEKVVSTVHKHGNTSAASIPLALDEYLRSGKIVAGQQILLEAFGGGLTWGSALIRI